MSTPLPGCMIGPSEPCEMFQEQTAEITRLRAELAALREVLRHLKADGDADSHNPIGMWLADINAALAFSHSGQINHSGQIK